MRKAEVLQAVIDTLQVEAESMLGSAHATRASGNDPHSKAESKYDTRATEENYLADGLARQAQALIEAVAAFRALDASAPAAKAVGLGALVEVEFAAGGREWFLLGPAAGGTEVRCSGREITVLTPESPLGGQLLGLSVGGLTQAPRATVRTIG